MLVSFPLPGETVLVFRQSWGVKLAVNFLDMVAPFHCINNNVILFLSFACGAGERSVV